MDKDIHRARVIDIYAYESIVLSVRQITTTERENDVIQSPFTSQEVRKLFVLVCASPDIEMKEAIELLSKLDSLHIATKGVEYYESQGV